ncbi:ABC transporter substrate-binding protein [Nocardia abscessus]|uniref:ABC transporter substrate-binding protein n=1 Tax=Nocardia abscessus TaxID=120957 RepID=UPI002454729F|nr:ABC transporter substrate-binding protein [Nocardia abscessus]
MKKIVSGLALGASALLLVSACGSSGSAASDAAGSVTAAKLAGPDYLPMLYSVENGVFKDKGLDVTLVDVVGPGPALSALASNSVNMVDQTPTLAAQARERGDDVRMFCGIVPVQYNTIYANKDVKLPNLQEAGDWKSVVQSWRGKDFGVPVLQGASQGVVEQLLNEAGVPLTDVTFVATGLGAQAVAALTSGSVDMTLTYPLQSELMHPSEAKLVLDLSKDVPDKINNVQVLAWMANKAWLEGHADEATAWCEGIQVGIDAIKDPANVDAVRRILSSQYGLTKDFQLDAATRADNPLRVLSTELNCSGIEANLKASQARGVIKPETSTSCTDYIWTAN